MNSFPNILYKNFFLMSKHILNFWRLLSFSLYGVICGRLCFGKINSELNSFLDGYFTRERLGKDATLAQEQKTRVFFFYLSSVPFLQQLSELDCSDFFHKE